MISSTYTKTVWVWEHRYPSLVLFQPMDIREWLHESEKTSLTCGMIDWVICPLCFLLLLLFTLSNLQTKSKKPPEPKIKNEQSSVVFESKGATIGSEDLFHRIMLLPLMLSLDTILHGTTE